MLQFTIIPNNIIGAKDQAEMAVNSGCQWIDIDPTDLDTDTLKQIIEICKKAGVILVYKHHDQCRSHQKEGYGSVSPGVIYICHNLLVTESKI